MPRKYIFPLPLWFYENAPPSKAKVASALGVSIATYLAFRKKTGCATSCMDFLNHLNNLHFWFGERKCKKCGKLKTQEYFNRGAGYICHACFAKDEYKNKKADEEYKRKRKQINRKHYIKNKEKISETYRLWYNDNKCRVSYNRRKWKMENPTSVKISKKKRALVVIKDNSEIINNIKKTHCYWCGKALHNKYHLDHVVPIAKGGSHAAYNLVSACSVCNLSKGAKMPNDFLKKGQLELEML